MDTLGLLLAVLVTLASVHHTVGGRWLLLAVYFAGRRLRCLCTDSGFAGTLAAWAARLLSVTSRWCADPQASQASRSYRSGGSWNAGWRG